MTKLLAGVFAGFSMLFGGLFGHHAAPAGDMASSSSNHMTGTSTPWGAGGMGSTTPGHMGMMPGVMGTVESIDGTSLTVSGHAGMNSATTTYTIDASAAKVIKAASGKMASSTLADVNVGDKVLVQGTVSGTSVTAKTIIDGVMAMMGGMGGKGGPMHGMHMASSTSK